MLINQSDQVTIGWAVDSQGGRMYVDLHATAVAWFFTGTTMVGVVQ